ncbi:hypothetical protein DFH08DRAFT_810164 [Mycena albidolilacea]|uniref:Uncharacterized protein n=1 Tax=Mycena albidolilacea TaxID=1033008 RepID=A0AAD7EPL5_9AGAR|nr:hypothetical protein DFH08DRAFT_810164 [Mycena albidolilacea]
MYWDIQNMVQHGWYKYNTDPSLVGEGGEGGNEWEVAEAEEHVDGGGGLVKEWNDEEAGGREGVGEELVHPKVDEVRGAQDHVGVLIVEGHPGVARACGCRRLPAPGERPPAPQRPRPWAPRASAEHRRALIQTLVRVAQSEIPQQEEVPSQWVAQRTVSASQQPTRGGNAVRTDFSLSLLHRAVGRYGTCLLLCDFIQWAEGFIRKM